MDQKEKARLKELYGQYSDDALIVMVLGGESAYEKGVYELILEEAKKRKLEPRIERIRKEKVQEEPRIPEDAALVTVYAGIQLEVQLIKSMLESEGIMVFLKDEIIGSTIPPYAAGGGAGAIKVVIAEKDLQRAKPIIQEFSNRKG